MAVGGFALAFVCTLVATSAFDLTAHVPSRADEPVVPHEAGRGGLPGRRRAGLMERFMESVVWSCDDSAACAYHSLTTSYSIRSPRTGRVPGLRRRRGVWVRRVVRVRRRGSLFLRVRRRLCLRREVCSLAHQQHAACMQQSGPLTLPAGRSQRPHGRRGPALAAPTLRPHTLGPHVPQLRARRGLRRRLPARCVWH